MRSKFSTSCGISARTQSVLASFWVTIAVLAAVLPTICHTLGYEATNVANKVMTAGPIEDALEYLLWLLRQGQS